MAKQAFVLSANSPVSLVMVHDASGSLKQVCTMFESKTLPTHVQPHCRTAFFVKKGTKVTLVSAAEKPR
jgi:hypothetical protein